MLNLDDKDRQIAYLEQKLAEKDKEIKNLLTNHLEKCFVSFKEEHDKEIIHQVCEEIRKLEIRHRYDGDTNSVIDGYFVDKEILDQIEQGESDEKNKK